MFDSVVVGGGAAGTACALKLREKGCRVAVVEREPHLGGILMQCIHNGFGLHRFGEELTGPEYASRFAKDVESTEIECFREATVQGLDSAEDGWSVEMASARYGFRRLSSRSVIFANGCRERNRGNIGIAGGRPAGVMTAGLAQRLLNVDGYTPGKSAVIIGSGDIGLIMARRLTWCGVKVKAVVEIMPYPAGLARNISQCLDDFSIPLYLNHAVTGIKGRGRVSGVTVTPLDNGRPRNEESFDLDCDTVLLSVGLIPQTGILRRMGAALNPATGGAVVDSSYMTDLPGVFSCGNALHVHDLVDHVSLEAESCADAAAKWLGGEFKITDTLLSAGANIKYVVPSKVCWGEESCLCFRVLRPMRDVILRLTCGDRVLVERKKAAIRPSEMEKLVLTKDSWPEEKGRKLLLEIIHEEKRGDNNA